MSRWSGGGSPSALMTDRRRRAHLLPWLTLATLGWIALVPWPLSGAAAEVDRRALIWALALLTLLQAHLLRRALSGVGWPLALALVAGCLSELLSLAHALHPLAAAFGAPERGLGLLDQAAWWLCLLGLLGALRATASCATALTAALALSGLGLAVLTLGEWLLVLQHTDVLPRAAGVQRNPSFTASLLAPLLVLGLLHGWAVRVARRDASALPAGAFGHRGLAVCLAVYGMVLLLALLATGSRAALLAAAVGLAVGWLCRPAVPARSPFGAVGIGTTALLLALAVGLAWWGGQLRPASLQIRAELYAAAVAAPLQPQPLQRWHGGEDPHHALRPWLGLGRDNLEPALTRARPASLNALEADGHDRFADRSHSLWLDRWMEGGALALMTLAALLLALWQRLRQVADTEAVRAAWRASLPAAAALSTALVDRSVGVPSAGADLLLAMLLALSLLPLARLCCGNPDSGSGKAAGIAQVPPRRRHSLKGWAAGLAAMLLLLLGAGVLGGLHDGLWRADWSPAAPWHALAGEHPAGCTSQPALAIALAQQPYSALPLLRMDAAARQRCLALGGTPDFLVRAAPTQPRAWLERSAQALQDGDAGLASAALRQALLLIDDPGTLSATQAGMLWAAIAAGDAVEDSRRQAADEAMAALAGTPVAARDASWWRTVGWLRATLGDRSGAIAAYRSALALQPADAASRRNLARLLDAAAAAEAAGADPP